ncbi:MAG TPA: hypothetical protein V6C65_15720 [Allocoleopsis sp.]
MVGSIKFFVYTTDGGDDFAIKLDESNTEAVNGGTQDFPAVAPTRYALPRNVKPRTLIYSNTDRTVTRRVVALTQAIYSNAVTAVPSITDASSGQTLSLFRQVGEEVSLPFGADTGLTDGDDT